MALGIACERSALAFSKRVPKKIRGQVVQRIEIKRDGKQSIMGTLLLCTVPLDERVS